MSTPTVGHQTEGALTSEDLVEEDLDVVCGEGLRGHDDLMEVALHQLCDHVAVDQFTVKKKKQKLTEKRVLRRLRTTL